MSVERNTDLSALEADLRKAAARSDIRRHPCESNRIPHVCTRAANAIRDLTAAGPGTITVAEVIRIFNDRLNLTYDQRAYSWHEIQFALDEVRKHAPQHGGTK